MREREGAGGEKRNHGQTPPTAPEPELGPVCKFRFTLAGRIGSVLAGAQSGLLRRR
jgi:hypothetical protein